MGSVKLLGWQPGTDLPVRLKRGPFGLYVKLARRGWGVCGCRAGEGTGVGKG